MKLFTLGFSRKSAEAFFGLLKNPEITRLVDIRLNNVSQLAGFTKKNDLRYFVKALTGRDYLHLPLLAPSKEILDAYRKRGGGWAEYERRFLALLKQRRIEGKVPKATLAGACLLCSEATPERCHRRLVAEYLRDRWRGVEIVHL